MSFCCLGPGDKLHALLAVSSSSSLEHALLHPSAPPFISSSATPNLQTTAVQSHSAPVPSNSTSTTSRTISNHLPISAAPALAATLPNSEHLLRCMTALMRRATLPGSRQPPPLSLAAIAGLCAFCFLLGFFSGGSLRFAPQFDASQAQAPVAATAPRRLQAHQQHTNRIQPGSSSSSSNSIDAASAPTTQPPETHQPQQQQQQDQVAAPTPKPAALPDHEAFTKQCLEQTGLLQLRPPLQPAASGNNFYTLAPFQILSWHPRILVFPNFVSPSQAAHVIAMARGRMRPSGLAWRPDETPDEHQQTRTSSGVFLSSAEDPDGVLAALEQKISHVTMLPVSHGEAFNVLRYERGQRYESHMDTFDPKEFGAQPSQRMATVLLYLSDVEQGGETVFKREGVKGAERPITDWSSCEPGEFKYTPRLGDAVLFYSLDPDLTIQPRSLHGGCAVTGEKEKWVATKWIHEKPV